MGFRYIFDEEMLNNIRIGSINFHPGLLPQYKGSFSTAWSIINGEEFVGYTYHYIDAKVDSGNILHKKRFKIQIDDTAHNLHYKIWFQGMLDLPLVMEKCINGEPGEPQSNGGRYFKNALPFDGNINIEWGRNEIEKFIRAMYFPPFAPAKIMLDGTLKLISNIEEYDAHLDHFLLKNKNTGITR